MDNRYLSLLLLFLLVFIKPITSLQDVNEKLNISDAGLCPEQCRCDKLTSVNSNQRLFTVDCSYQKLELIPNNIFINTQALTLRGNFIKYVNDQLSNLSNILELDLSDNKIKALSRGSFFQSMTELTYLNLAKNELTSLATDSFLGLNKLECLILSKNHITNIGGNAFGSLENLKRLYLDSNMIGSLYEDWFVGLKSLVNLTLAHNSIHHISRYVFRAAAQLNQLVLSANRINGIEPLGLSGLSKLEYLSLDNNLLASVPTSALQTLENLNRLEMDVNPIVKLQAYSFSEISAKEISLRGLNDLRIVDGFAFHNMFNLSLVLMHDNEKLSFIDPEAFANATALRKLLIHNNNLASFSISDKNFMTDSLEISLNGNPLICDCNLRWIKTKASKVKIIDENKLDCYGPKKYKGKHITDITAAELPKECSPTVIDLTSSKSLIRKLGDPLTLECRTLGIPTPKLHWLLPDGTVLNSTSNSVRVRLRNPGTLIFYNLKATDSGQYVCIAENSFGTQNISITLRVTGIDIHLFPTGISSTFITLVWNGTARNAFPSYQILYKLADNDSKWSDQVSVSSFGRSYTINNLIPDTKYKFCITFEDKQGFYINISCTTAKTQTAEFMMQGIQRTSSVALLTFAVMGSMVFTICIVTLAIRKYRHRFYENPEKTNNSNIPLDNLYSPLISSMGS